MSSVKTKFEIKSYNDIENYLDKNTDCQPSHFDTIIILTNKDVNNCKRYLIEKTECPCLDCIISYISIMKSDIFMYHNYFIFCLYFQVLFNMIIDAKITRFSNLIHTLILDIFKHHQKNIKLFTKQHQLNETELYQFQNNDCVYIKDIQTKFEINCKVGKVIRSLPNYRFEIEFYDKEIKNTSISIYNLGLIEDESELEECCICFETIEQIQICPGCFKICCYKCYIKNNTSCDKCFFCSYEWKIEYSEKMNILKKKINALTQFVKVFD